MARATAAELWNGSAPSVRTYCEKLLAALLSPIGITTEACSLDQVGKGTVNLQLYVGIVSKAKPLRT
jgi:hypothetical protein